MYDIIRAPVITEKATLASEHNQVMFRVPLDADQARDQGGGRGPVRRQGDGGQHDPRRRQDQALPGPAGPALRRQEGDRDAGRRLVDRRHHGNLSAHGTEDLQSDHARSQRQLVIVDRSELWKGKPVKALTEGHEQHGRPQQSRPHHHALARRRAQAALPHRRFQAPQVRRAGDGRAARIRSEPHRVHRADQVRGRRAGLHPGAAAAARRRQGGRRRAGRHQAGQRDAAAATCRSARSSTMSR